MFVVCDIEIDEDALNVMKRRASQMVFEAKAALEAYRDALLHHWEEMIARQIGTCPYEKYPVECELNDMQGRRLIQVCNVSLDFQNNPIFEFHEKTKSGKWGKSTFVGHLPCRGLSKVSSIMKREQSQ
jgi:hypothetical protein